MPNLIVLTGLRRGTVLPLQERAVIGREAAVDLRLPDFLVSSRHAEIIPEPNDAFRLTDLASTNGTYRNGERVTVNEPLTLGDVLLFGSTEVLFTEAADVPEPQQSEVHDVLMESGDPDEDREDPYEIRLLSDTDELILPESHELQGLHLALPVVDAVQRSFSLAWSLEDLQQRVVDRFLKASGGSGVVLALRSGPEEQAQIVYRGTLSGDEVFREEEPSFAVRDDLLERGLQERGAQFSRAGPDSTSTSVIRIGPEAGTPMSAGMALCISLPSAAGIVGAVYMHDVRPGLTKEDLRLLFLMANLAGVHLRDHLLLGSLRTRNEELKKANWELQQARTELAELVEAQSEELGRASRQMRLFARVVENVPQAVVSTTLDGEVTSWNPAAETLYGYLAGEVLGQVLPTIPDDKTGEFERILDAVGSGRSLSGRGDRVTKAEERIPIEATFAPVTGSNGEVVGLVEIGRDLTEEIREDIDRRWRERMASFGELATGLAHELGNPLANLRSGVEYLLAKERPPEKRESSMRLLHTEILRLQRLATQALDLARWKPPSMGEADCGELLDYVAAQLGPRADVLEVKVVRTRTDGPTAVLGDGDQLKQALLNLTANALDAMPNGGRLELSTIREETAGGSVGGFRVRDTGRGIAASDLVRVFDLFYSRRKGGSGIGLAIVKRIVDMHNGTIDVASEPGEGTTVTIRLTRAADAEEEA